MRLARRLTWTIIAGMCLILLAEALVRMRRNAEVFEDDMRRDHVLIGQSVGRAIAEAPRVSTWQETLDRIAQTLEHNDLIRIRRVDAIPAEGSGARDGRFYSYVPLPSDSPVGGFIEVSESLNAERHYVRASALRTFGVTVTLAVIAAVFSALLGFRMIGFPVRELAEKARRVGAGELGPPLMLAQRDELGDLAREMNLMCDRLAAAHARIASESQARIATLEALRHSDRLATVGKLASGIAHEMGTPLNVILARGKMIAEGEGTSEELADYGRIVVEQADRLTRIIRQLLDFARGRTPSHAALASTAKASVDLRKLAQSMCLMLAPLAGKQGVSLSVAEGRTEAVTLANQSLMEQALANLVINAVQASARGGAVSIVVGAERAMPPADVGRPEATYLTLAVRDQGTGIAPGDLPRIFEPFFTTKEVGEGTGLGLSVAHGIVREHGGWISVESQPGRGSCFTIFLPASQSA